MCEGYTNLAKNKGREAYLPDTKKQQLGCGIQTPELGSGSPDRSKRPDKPKRTKETKDRQKGTGGKIKNALKGAAGKIKDKVTGKGGEKQAPKEGRVSSSKGREGKVTQRQHRPPKGGQKPPTQATEPRPTPASDDGDIIDAEFTELAPGEEGTRTLIDITPTIGPEVRKPQELTQQAVKGEITPPKEEKYDAILQLTFPNLDFTNPKEVKVAKRVNDGLARMLLTATELCENDQVLLDTFVSEFITDNYHRDISDLNNWNAIGKKKIRKALATIKKKLNKRAAPKQQVETPKPPATPATTQATTKEKAEKAIEPKQERPKESTVTKANKADIKKGLHNVLGRVRVIADELAPRYKGLGKIIGNIYKAKFRNVACYINPDGTLAVATDESIRIQIEGIAEPYLEAIRMIDEQMGLESAKDRQKAFRQFSKDYSEGYSVEHVISPIVHKRAIDEAATSYTQPQTKKEQRRQDAQQRRRKRGGKKRKKGKK